DKNSAIWLNDHIYDWNSNNLNWDRKIEHFNVMLINSQDLDHIYEILKAGKYVYQIYGISKDPTSHSYILIFDEESYNKNLYDKNSAIWLNGYICDWNSNNLNWNRKIKNFKVMLINSEDLDHIYKILKAGKYVYQIYGISKDPTSHIYILVFDDEGYNQNLYEIIQKLNHFETDDIIFEELRNYNNGVIKQYFELTSKSDHLKTSNSSKLHSINPSNFTGVLYCCISNENEEIGSASTSRNNYQVTNLSSETVIIDDSSECDNCIIKLNLSDNLPD
ncbi:19559_t:CDS:2, partial [Rhizophagus irregularis]